MWRLQRPHYLKAIDEAWGQEDWIFAKFFFFFFCLFMEWDRVEFNREKERSHYLTILTTYAWSRIDSLYYAFSWGTQMVISITVSKKIPSCSQGSNLNSQLQHRIWVANYSSGFGLFCPVTELGTRYLFNNWKHMFSNIIYIWYMLNWTSMRSILEIYLLDKLLLLSAMDLAMLQILNC